MISNVRDPQAGDDSFALWDPGPYQSFVGESDQQTRWCLGKALDPFFMLGSDTNMFLLSGGKNEAFQTSFISYDSDGAHMTGLIPRYARRYRGFMR
jgi:hypothetical protein